MTAKSGTVRSQVLEITEVAKSKSKPRLSTPIAPSVVGLDGKPVPDESQLNAAIATLKRRLGEMPRVAPLSDAELNDRCRMLEQQRQQLMGPVSEKDQQMLEQLRERRRKFLASLKPQTEEGLDENE